MANVIDELKSRARLLHAAVKRGEAGAVAKVDVVLREEARGGDEEVQRRHCLAVVARELGFEGWSHLALALEGKRDDFGALF